MSDSSSNPTTTTTEADVPTSGAALADRRTVRVRPGVLVNLSTRMEGGVEYKRQELGHETEGATDVSRWETEKRIADREEHERAVKVRGRIRSIIRSACVWTPFGMICPTDQEAVLDEKIAEARGLERLFNRGGVGADGVEVAPAVHSRVKFSVMRGRIAENAAEAVTAVREEIQSLLGDLDRAIRSADVDGIRSVAQQATQMGRLLEDGTAARTALDRAVRESRRVATELLKRVEDGAEAAAEVIAQANLSLVATASHAFSEDELGEITDDGAEAPAAAALEAFAGMGDEDDEPAVPAGAKTLQQVVDEAPEEERAEAQAIADVITSTLGAGVGVVFADGGGEDL